MEYRDLNSESLPLINNLLQKQQGKGIFSVLHLKPGYHQMTLAKTTQDATAMTTLLRLMRWKVMPMLVKNGNTQFQLMTENLLQTWTGQICSLMSSLSPAGSQR